MAAADSRAEAADPAPSDAAADEGHSSKRHEERDQLLARCLLEENRRLRKQLQEKKKGSMPDVLGAANITPHGWRMFNIVLAFFSGSLFVAADYNWARNQFFAGILYTVGGGLLVVAVPALHASGMVWHDGYRLIQPFAGGIRFVVLQALSWLFYALTVVVLVGAVYYGEDAAGWLSGGGVLGILSQVMMASSLHMFVAPEGKPTALEDPCSPCRKYYKACSVSSLQLNDGLDEPMDLLASSVDTPAASASFLNVPEEHQPTEQMEKMDNFAELVTMNVILILVMACLSAISELFGLALPALLSLIVTCVTVFLTHGLGGNLLGLDGWKFFQPFAGGTQFVIMQAIAWMLFSISLLCHMAFLYGVVLFGVKITVGLMKVGGVAAFASEMLCILSFRYYKERSKLKAAAGVRDQVRDMTDADLAAMPKESWASLAVVIFFWNLQYIPIAATFVVALLPVILPVVFVQALAPFSLGVFYVDVSANEVGHATFLLIFGVVTWAITNGVASSFNPPPYIRWLLFPPWTAFVALSYSTESRAFPMMCFLAAVWFGYMLTYLGEPDKGKRNRTANWAVQPWIWDLMAAYFGGRVLVSEKLARVMKEGKGPADETAQHIVGYHPHGVMPGGMVWGIRCSEWQKQFPKFTLTGLTASIVHYVPFMRDMLHWTGTREVSKKTFLATIDEGLNPAVVVGGQAEMFMSTSRAKEVPIVTFHNGVFKIACERRIPMIPIFAFGEQLTLDNVEVPAVQKWFKERLGFPIPFIPVGRWGLPVPRRVKVIIAVGAPVAPPDPRPSGPTWDDVLDFKKRYFDALLDLFNEFKDRAGHDNHTLCFVSR
ncbi:Diacylglycerol O-acyltransferase 2 [Diplonema papillatum]|nr:Diacylglycerol O-acyltransferase 2 [Diplonema papillatum]|eukprot:gene719-1097_t